MAVRLIALLLVAALLFLDTVGHTLLEPTLHMALSLLAVLAIIVLFLHQLSAWRSDDDATVQADVAFARIGPRAPLAALLLSSVATLLCVWLWEWQPRADFDVTGILWILQNVPGIALVTIFGTMALVSLGVLIRILAVSHRP